MVDVALVHGLGQHVHALQGLCKAELGYDRDDSYAFPEMFASQGRVQLVATDGPTIVGTAFCSVRNSIGFFDLLAVRSDYQNRGIGKRLVSLGEMWMRGQGCSEAHFSGNPPVYAWPGIDIRYSRALCLAESCGYIKFRAEFNMEVCLPEIEGGLRSSLDADILRLRDAGIYIRRLTKHDRTSVEPWLKSFESAWHAEVFLALAADKSACYVATNDAGEYLGFAVYGVNRPNRVGPMATDPSCRGLGIGAALLRTCLMDQLSNGLKTAQFFWVGPHTFFSKLVGAQITRIFWRYRKEL